MHHDIQAVIPEQSRGLMTRLYQFRAFPDRVQDQVEN